MPNTIESPLLDVNEAAKFIHVSRATIYRLIDEGRIPNPVKIGSRVLFRIEELELWIQADCPRSESELWKEIKRTGKAIACACLIMFINSLVFRR